MRSLIDFFFLISRKSERVKIFLRKCSRIRGFLNRPSSSMATWENSFFIHPPKIPEVFPVAGPFSIVGYTFTSDRPHEGDLDLRMNPSISAIDEKKLLMKVFILLVSIFPVAGCINSIISFFFTNRIGFRGIPSLISTSGQIGMNVTKGMSSRICSLRI